MRPHRRQPTRLPRPWDSPGKNTGVSCHFLLQCTRVKNASEVAQSCSTLRDPMVCSLPGSSTHGAFQARVLEWGPLPSPMMLLRNMEKIFLSLNRVVLWISLSAHPDSFSRPLYAASLLRGTYYAPEHHELNSSLHKLPWIIMSNWASLVAQMVKNLPTMQKTWVRSLGWEDPLEEGMATHSSILAWRIPWTEEPGGATVYGVSKSQTRVKQLSMHSV